MIAKSYKNGRPEIATCDLIHSFRPYIMRSPHHHHLFTFRYQQIPIMILKNKVNRQFPNTWPTVSNTLALTGGSSSYFNNNVFAVGFASPTRNIEWRLQTLRRINSWNICGSLFFPGTENGLKNVIKRIHLGIGFKVSKSLEITLCEVSSRRKVSLVQVQDGKHINYIAHITSSCPWRPMLCLRPKYTAQMYTKICQNERRNIILKWDCGFALKVNFYC